MVSTAGRAGRSNATTDPLRGMQRRIEAAEGGLSCAGQRLRSAVRSGLIFTSRRELNRLVDE